MVKTKELILLGVLSGIILIGAVMVSGGITGNIVSNFDSELCGTWEADYKGELILNHDGAFSIEMESPSFRESGKWEIQDKTSSEIEGIEINYKVIVVTTKEGKVREFHIRDGSVLIGPYGEDINPLNKRGWTLKERATESSSLQVQASTVATIEKVSGNNVAAVSETVLTPSGPGKTMEAYFKDLQKGEYETMREYCSSDGIEEYEQQSENWKVALKKQAEQFEEIGFRASIISEVIKGNEATVSYKTCSDQEECYTSSIAMIKEYNKWKIK